MNVLIVSPGTDIAGQAYGLAQAVNRHAPGWEARAVCRQLNAFDYPTDIVWPLRQESAEVAELFRQADVVHVMDNPRVIRLFDDWQSKRIIVEHLGTRYRRDPEGMSAYCETMGAVQITGGLDFTGLPYLPLVCDLDRMAALREKHYRPGPVRVVHAPTNREFKSTELVLEVVDRLKARHEFEFDLIEGVSWTECLERKARADILVDELTLGYGSNAIEAWGMGIPVVSGIADPDFRAAIVKAFGALPFLEATADTLESRLEALIVDPLLRRAWGERGRAHAQRVHSEAAVVGKALSLYELARESVAA